MRAAFSVLALACMLAATAAMAAPAAAPAVPAAPASPTTPATPAAPAVPAAPDAVAPPSDDVIRQRIVGSWGQTADCKDGSLTFKTDGTFISKGVNEPTGATGTYAIDKGRLSGENGDGEMPVMLINFDGEAMLLDDGSGNPQRLARCQAQQ